MILHCAWEKRKMRGDPSGSVQAGYTWTFNQIQDKVHYNNNLLLDRYKLMLEISNSKSQKFMREIITLKQD